MKALIEEGSKVKGKELEQKIREITEKVPKNQVDSTSAK